MVDIKSTIYYLNRDQEERHVEENAKRLALPYVNLANYPLTSEVLSYIPEEDAIRYRVIPYLKVGRSLKVGAMEPKSPEVTKFINDFGKTIGCDLVPAVISKSSFLYSVASYEKYRKEKEEEAQKVSDQKKEDMSEAISDVQSVAEAVKKVSTTKLLEILVTGAIKTNSSDIHLEPNENALLVRYRIDGILQDVVELTPSQYKQLISRIKYLAKMRMDMIDKPQDGRFSIKFAEESIDLRVSIMPSTFGESVVMRLLGQEKSILNLESLGFRPEALAAIKAAITKPYGMILNSGPTGSGKSSTLYAVLMALKKPGVKIITLENPVEYRIEGIEQSQVAPGAGYEFADGLKAAMRQDPDILMVGEIRDGETAEIAVQAALTGHLLLSTIHANNAPAVFARLLEIGVKPFLLSGSVNLIIAQRLVRKICPYCRQEYSPSVEIWQEVQRVLTPLKDKLSQQMQEILAKPTPILVHGAGCEKCNRSGYIGRQVIAEVLTPSEKVEALVVKSAAISEFRKTALAEGMVTMEQDGLMKVLQGLTTIDEVWRVTRS